MRAVLGIAALCAIPAASAMLGASGGRAILLNFGPGDGPYVSGFLPGYEIDEKVATHWTSHRAEARLPLALEGGGELRYRFARVLPETAQVETEFAGRTVDRFACRGGV